MAANYGHFEDGSSSCARTFPSHNERGLSRRIEFGWIQLTPSFFCRLEDEVVYWNTSRLSG